MNTISVIIRTHNPRLEYLNRVLKSLEEQTLSSGEWELLLIDNNSDYPLTRQMSLGWHPNARLITEQQVGIVHATFRGISESKGSLLVFVDDDNVLRPDYLEIAFKIFKNSPMLGAWSGQIEPEFEVAPSEDIRIFLPMLCIRDIKKDFWSNTPNWNQLPWGAGMCFRREVGQRHCQDILNNPLRLSMGHTGNRRSCHLDTDLGLACLELGFGVGLFKSLILKHLIPEKRLNKMYFLQLAENSVVGFELLKRIRGIEDQKPSQGLMWWVEKLKYLTATTAQKEYIRAMARGKKIAKTVLAELSAPKEVEMSSNDKMIDQKHLIFSNNSRETPNSKVA